MDPSTQATGNMRASQRENIPMTRGNDQRRACAFSFQNGISRCRRAVVDELECAVEVFIVLLDLVAHFGDAVEDADALVWDCGGDFGAEGVSGGCENEDVCEGAADVDA